MIVTQIAPPPKLSRLVRAVAPAVAALVGLGSFVAPALADVRLPAVLADHMVLQQGSAVPVWGWADAGEEVTVTFGEQKQTAKAGEDGKWSVKLKPLTASDKPAELTVAGKNTIKLADVLVGEVWVCSGQSNMEWPVNRSKDADKEKAAAKFPSIRLFTVPRSVKEEPQSDTQGKWSAADDPKEVGNFSGVGYFFGREIHQKLGVPVGLIHSSWGGTVAEAWADRPALERDEAFKTILDNAEKMKTSADYEQRVATWKAEVEKAKAEGKKPPKPPQNADDNPNRASVLYNGMIAPIVPFAAKGAIWYQGESNAGRATEYRKLLPAMIGSWRDAWAKGGADGTFHFYIVQLANFQAVAKEPGNHPWAELREAQAMTAAMPNNGLAVAIDLADADNPGDIHPTNKQDVGKRLAYAALHNVYGKTEVVPAGPSFDAMKVEDGGKVRITFKHAKGLKTKDGGPAVKGFALAGEDGKWAWADATIDGDAVVLSSDKVKVPTAVRYAWAVNPEANLYNAADLPAVPFRAGEKDDKVKG